MKLTAYFDETGTSGGAERLTAVGGYLFDENGRAEFQRLYRQQVEPLLPDDRQGRKMFHTGPCVGGYPPFRGMLEAERENILRRMADVIQGSVTMGAVIAMEPAEYKLGVSGRFGRIKTSNYQLDDLTPWVGSKYSLCLLKCMEAIGSWLKDAGIDAAVHYVFEAGCNHQSEAEGIVARVAAVPKLSKQARLGSYEFVPKSPDCPWLFASDLLAWEWQRADQNAMEPHRREWRDTMANLVDARPHVAAYLTAGTVLNQAFKSFLYGLKYPEPARADGRSAMRSAGLPAAGTWRRERESE